MIADQHALPARFAKPLRGIAVGALATLASTSCAANRTLTITSEPAGAEVRIDDVIVGETPVVLPFFHYGTRRMTFYLDGYLTESVDVAVEPPWFARFPLDYVTEIFIPIGWSDDHPVHVDLERGDDVALLPALQSVLERAEVLRRAGPAGPRELPASDLEQVGTDADAGDLDDRTSEGGSATPAPAPTERPDDEDGR
ncbi:MAG: PEGA domain-containing protein [Planctomycetota bacterium]|jgi:hypothetical protein